jgi:hypothetical protein
MLRNSTQYVCLNGLSAGVLLCGVASAGQARKKQLRYRREKRK